MTIVVRLLVVAAAIAAAGAFPASLSAQEKEKSPDTVVLPGGQRGAITFEHAKHAERTECASCHHASKPEKPLTKDYQKCRECHTKPVTEPMTTALRGAMHDPMAKKGTCIDCHVKEAAAGKTVPVKCADCHKKEGG